MQEVKSGEAQVEHVKQIARQADAGLGVQLIFMDLQHQKRKAKRYGQEQIANALAHSARLGQLDGVGSAKAAGDEQQGVVQAEISVQQQLLGVEQRYVLTTCKGVDHKQHAKNKQLGEDENPDRQIAGQGARAARNRS